MKRKIISSLVVVLILTLSVSWIINEKQANKPFFAVNFNHGFLPDSSTDILDDIKKINTDFNFTAISQFRKGHVTPKTIKDYLKKTSYGYSIQLSSFTNIPTPAIKNGKIYVSAGFGSKELYSFDAVTGNFNWGISLDDDGPSSPAISGNTIVFNTESCTIFACDLITGKQKWSYWLGDPLMSTPTIHNGLVFTSYPASYTANSNSNSKIFPSHILIAFDLESGAIKWQKWIDSDIMSAPVAKDDVLYVTTFSGSLYTVNQKTGEFISAKAIRATSAPIFDTNNNIIVSKRDDTKNDSTVSEGLYMFNMVTTVNTPTRNAVTTTSKKVYRKEAKYLDKKVQEKSALKTESVGLDAGNGFGGGAPTSSNYMAAMENIGQSNVSSLQGFQGSRGFFKNNRMYNTMGDELVCTDTSGKQVWKYSFKGDMNKVGGFIGTPPIYTNEYIIVATYEGNVLVLNEKDGKIVKEYQLKDPIRYQPIADKGWIYVTSVTGKLHAINTGISNITGWTMWGANEQRTNTIYMQKHL